MYVLPQCCGGGGGRGGGGGGGGGCVRKKKREGEEGGGERKETMLQSLILSGCHQVTDVGLRWVTRLLACIVCLLHDAAVPTFGLLNPHTLHTYMYMCVYVYTCSTVEYLI